MNFRELHQLIKDPVDWLAVTGEEDVEFWLSFYWYAIVKENDVDCEASLLEWMDWKNPSFFASMLDDHEMVRIEINIRTWIDRAKSHYLQKVRRFCELKVAEMEDYSKHYVVGDFDDESVCAISRRRGEGVLFPRINSKVQLSMIWSVLGARMNEVLAGEKPLEYATTPNVLKDLLDLHLFDTNNLKLVAEFPINIGAVSGLATRYCVIKIDCTTPIAHIHPITEIEAKRENDILDMYEFSFA